MYQQGAKWREDEVTEGVLTVPFDVQLRGDPILLQLEITGRDAVRVPSYDGVQEPAFIAMFLSFLRTDQEVVTLAIAVDEDPVKGPAYVQASSIGTNDVKRRPRYLSQSIGNDFHCQ